MVGKDRVFTNKNEIYTSSETTGDRYDPWLPGYNEVFSPYSSPSTCKWNNDSSGIFIWYHSYSGSGPSGVANLKFYKSGTGFSRDSILHLTPPSRPMGLRVEEHHPSGSSFCHPKLVWNHNMEPDMERTGKIKHYKIYVAKEMTMSTVPFYYDWLGTAEIHSDSVPCFIDFLVRKYECASYGSPPYGEQSPVRYYVKAVDKFDDISVPSDFVQTIALSGPLALPLERSSTNLNSEIPEEYNINQNYPNPFNPITKIKYDLPFDGNVKIKIYDINGRLVLTLVNENKTAGRYEIEFNGENLSSGIYYYKIESGNFNSVRKMILIK